MPPIRTALFRLIVTLITLLPSNTSAALEADDVDVSYVYAAVMGTGTYEINGRRVTMVEIPLSYTRREMTSERPGLVWTLPVSFGYDTVTDQDWFGDLLDEDLVTIAALPGFEYHIAWDETWRLKPFANLGLSHDFSTNENIWMGAAGMSALGLWLMPDGNEFRWGGSLQVAGEYQSKSYHHSSFGLFETGIDIRWDTPLRVALRSVDWGVYYIFQYYIPEWELDQLLRRESDIGAVHEFGLSVGLKNPVTLLGIEFSRVRLGHTRGSGVRGWTVGAEFPF
jgi:hypothetical protein